MAHMQQGSHSAAATLVAGSASRPLALRVERELELRFAGCSIERFPDGEVAVRVDEPVRGREVILLAATSAPVNDHLVELLAIADACRRDGRRTPIMASLVADLIERAGIDHVITTEIHTPALEGFFRVPVDNLTAVPVLAAALRARISRNAVIVAPDVGALRLANRYAAELDLPVAVCHKRRLGGAEVSVGRITGDVTDRPCVVVDDMISTGGTIAESVRALNDAGALPHAIVAAAHAVLVPGALDRIAGAGVRSLLVTDSIEPREEAAAGLEVEVVSIAPLVATAIRHLLKGGSLRALA